jgi:hypothetical protein
LPWSEELLERYADKWKWHVLSPNESLPWSEALIERYKYLWGWDNLSWNCALPWSEALIERYKDKWDYLEGLSKNKSLPWSEELLERYKDKWDWIYLSGYESLPLSEALIERFADKWYWPNLLANSSLPWSKSLIERFEDKWGWDHMAWDHMAHCLSSTSSLPWSEALIERYADELNWISLGNNKAVIKLFNSWTKQEISTALERIRSAQNDGDIGSAQEEKALCDFVEKTNYTEHQEWNKISFKYKERCGWKCEKAGCGLDLSSKSNRRFLQVHHINGNTFDCRPSNLIALCINHHSEEPDHSSSD